MCKQGFCDDFISYPTKRFSIFVFSEVAHFVKNEAMIYNAVILFY